MVSQRWWLMMNPYRLSPSHPGNYQGLFILAQRVEGLSFPSCG